MNTKTNKPLLISWIIFFGSIAFPYLLLAPKLGFYEDDWNYIGAIWGFNSSKPLRYLCAFDRPNLFYIYNFLAKHIGSSPIAWHLVLFTSLVILGLLSYRLIKKINYFNPNIALALAGIITLYPCNIMYYSAVTYSLPFTFPFIYFLASLLLTIGNYKNRSIQIIALIISGCLTLLHEIQIEYLLGLEIARILIVYTLLCLKNRVTFSRFDKKILRNSFLINIPNYLATFLYLVWRFLIFHTHRKETNQDQIIKDIITHPLKSIGERVPKMVSDIFNGLFGSYFNVFSEDLFSIRYLPGFQSLLFISLVMILLFIFRKKITKDTLEYKLDYSQKSIHFHLASIFIIISMISLLPSWFIDKHIFQNSGNSRFGFQLALPGAFVFVFLLAKLLKERVLLYSLWIYLALCSCFFYRTFLLQGANWNYQKIFYSQILWRYPKLPVGTSFVCNTETEQSPLREHVESPAVNFIYGYSSNPAKMNYWLYEWGSTYYKADSMAIKGHFSTDIYSQKFVAEREYQIPISYEVGKCLSFGKHNGIFQNGITPDFESFLVSNTLPEKIADTGGNIGKWPSKIMGSPVSQKCFCYYFQKAEYYNDLKKFSITDSLFNDLMTQKSIKIPYNLAELMPFVKAAGIIKGKEYMLKRFNNLISFDEIQSLKSNFDLIIEQKE